MSRDHVHDAEQIRDIDQLVEYFRGAAKPKGPFGVGTEHEKFGFDATTHEPLPYDGPRGIRRTLELLVERHGWNPHHDGPHLMALERDGAAITLEPGGQLELSGAILDNAVETAKELQTHIDEVRGIAEELGQVWCFLGMNPWDDLDAVPWMPKSRYGIMKRYLPTTADLPEWMMKMTCTVQANYDYRSESDAMDMLRTGALLSPLVTALYANSPYRFGKDSGFRTFRMEIWERTDPARCGVPAFFLDPQSTFRDYVEWVLDVPMFFIRRDDQYIDTSGQSFRRFLHEGIDGERATVGDFELHLSTLFPELRMKTYIEVRGADCASPEHIAALPALWKGIFYDDEARAQAAALVQPESPEDLAALYEVSRRVGLRGTWQGQTLASRAEALLAISAEGLKRQPGGDAEAALLSVFAADDGTLRDPAAALIDAWQTHNGDRGAVQAVFALK